jgi:hypothetical protein
LVILQFNYIMQGPYNIQFLLMLVHLNLSLSLTHSNLVSTVYSQFPQLCTVSSLNCVQSVPSDLHRFIVVCCRGAKIPVARSPGRPYDARWRLIFPQPHCGSHVPSCHLTGAWNFEFDPKTLLENVRATELQWQAPAPPGR